MASRRQQQAPVYTGPYAQKVNEVADDTGEAKMMSTNGELGGTLATDFGKKSALLSKMSSSSSSNCFSSSASEKMLKSSTTSSTSVTSKKAQIRHAVTSSSSAANCQEVKHAQQQQNEVFQENRNFSRSVSVTSNASSSSDSRLKLLSCSSRDYSVEEPLSEEELATDQQLVGVNSPQEMKFEHQRMSSSSKMKVSTSEGYTAEKVAATNQQRKKMSAGSISYEEAISSAALQEKMEAQGYSSEKVAAVRQDQVQLKTADSVQQQQRTAMASSMKLSTDEFTSEKTAIAKQEEKCTFVQGMVQAEKNVSSSSSSKMTFTSKGVSKSALATQNIHHLGLDDMTPSLGMNLQVATADPFSVSSSPDLTVTQGIDEDIEILKCDSPRSEVEKVMQRFNCRMSTCVERLKSASGKEAQEVLKAMSKLLKIAWSVPCYGHELGSSMCKILLNNGALEIIVNNCASENPDLVFRSAEVLELCLSTENRTYVVDNGLEKVVKAACSCSLMCSPGSRVGTGILQHLFKHSESTCSDVIHMGGLQSILFNCRSSDMETLRHCATALANLSLYGGPENQQSMIKHKVPVWLFPLAFHNDDNIKYYACLAISSLVANKEIEAAVLTSGTLDLVEPFVTKHSPEEFAKSHTAHAHGQSKNWLQRLVNVLNSKREEARNLAAFHFAMEAGIKKKQGNTEVFREVGAVEALKQVASCPNAIASKFAAQALQLIGEEVPHKLSQQVPLWTSEDVAQWVKQIGFSAYCNEFASSRVDGDLLLQLTEDMLKEDIGIKNGILRKRFLRELNQLKKMADYTSCDSTYLNSILQTLGPEFCQYTYQMLHCGVQKDTLKYIYEEQLAKECGISNSIHRLRIAQAIRGMCQHSESAEEEESNQKPLDVFVSYRRSNGSQLASLLKVHLQLRGFSVFIDVERLEAGKFDYNLLDSIRQAKHFLLVLTPNALERCIDDNECKDWVHKEIVEALQSQCNIIPILDNFQWPEPETLPEDMRAVCYFNGVRWIHDYQDACVDKLERFMRGEMNVRSEGPLGRFVNISGGAGTPGTPGTIVGALPSASRSLHGYQRSTSNESAKNGTAPLIEEKECCNGDASEQVNDTGHNSGS